MTKGCQSSDHSGPKQIKSFLSLPYPNCTMAPGLRKRHWQENRCCWWVVQGWQMSLRAFHYQVVNLPQPTKGWRLLDECWSSQLLWRVAQARSRGSVLWVSGRDACRALVYTFSVVGINRGAWSWRLNLLSPKQQQPVPVVPATWCQ